MLDEHVLLAHRREQVDGLGALGRREVRVRAREELRELEVAAIDVGDGEQAPQVERRRQPVDLAVADLQLAAEHVEDLGVDLVLDLEADRRPEPATRQLLLQCGQEVLGVVLLDLEVLVAGDAEGEVLLHEHPGEELVEVAGDDVLERHEPLALDVGVDVLLDEDEPRQARRHLDPGEVLRPRLRVLQQHGEVEREARDVRERVRGVDGERRQHRKDAVGEEEVQRLALLLAEVVPAHDGDALLLQLGAHLVLEDGGVLQHQLVGQARDALEELSRLETGGGAHGQAGGDAALEAGDAHHEVLVEVVGEDREEAGALEERDGRVHRELQHALVELQPRQLALEVAVGGQLVLGLVGGWHADEAAVGGPGRDAAGVDGARERADLGALDEGLLPLAPRVRHALAPLLARLLAVRFAVLFAVLLGDVGGGQAARAHGFIVAPFGHARVNSSQPSGTSRAPGRGTSAGERHRSGRGPRVDRAAPAGQGRANCRCTSTSSKPRPRYVRTAATFSSST